MTFIGACCCDRASSHSCVGGTEGTGVVDEDVVAGVDLNAPITNGDAIAGIDLHLITFDRQAITCRNRNAVGGGLSCCVVFGGNGDTIAGFVAQGISDDPSLCGGVVATDGIGGDAARLIGTHLCVEATSHY